MKYCTIFLLFIVLFSCTKPVPNTLEKGMYKAELLVQDHQWLPFVFQVDSGNSLRIFNAEEVIEVHEITYKNDSVYIQTPIFEGYIVAKIKDTILTGRYIKESEDRVVPFKATKDAIRFTVRSKDTPVQIEGNWETIFSEDSKDDRYIAKGIFSQSGNKVTGTIRTTSGDYRYLEGVMDKDSLKLSTFDGAHAFLFHAKVTDSTMQGIFYSGNHWREPFTAKRNDSYELPSANELTFIKKGYDRLDFSFENEQGDLVSLNDKRFLGKVIVVQIMGTWCPNCLDESRYYSQYIKAHPDTEVEFIALAFEYAKTKEAAFKRIRRWKNKAKIPYDVLLAQFGTSDKKLAQEKLPMLNHIISYPTSIYINKKGIIRKIHTGFNGPATGQKHLEFKKDFESFLETLSKE